MRSPLPTIIIAISLPLLLASPVRKRALSLSDGSVLQLAHYLELLELGLYTEGCDNFTNAQFTDQGFPRGFRDNICVIASHEQTHVGTIAAILGANGITPLQGCTYNFPYNDSSSFVSLANMVTSIGTGAYLGSSGPLNDSTVLGEAAASILAVEARHDAYLRVGIGATPFPTAFDTRLSAVWAYNLAQMFVVSCPQQLPLVRLPRLNIISPAQAASLQPPIAAGTTIGFSWDPSTFFVSVNTSAPLYTALVNQNSSAPIFQQISITGRSNGTIPVPAGVAGATYACLTTFSGGLTLDDLGSYGTLAGPVQLILS